MACVRLIDNKASQHDETNVKHDPAKTRNRCHLPVDYIIIILSNTTITDEQTYYLIIMRK